MNAQENRHRTPLRARALRFSMVASLFLTPVIGACGWPAGMFVPGAVANAQDEHPAPLSPDQQMQFVREKIQPLLQSRCAECHGTVEEPKGGLRLTSRSSMLAGGDSGPALVPGSPDDSLLLQAVRYESFEMPPRTRLPDEEVALLERWIAMDAPWPDTEQPDAVVPVRAAFPLEERRSSHWAWQPIRRPDVAAAVESAGDRDPVDWLIHGRLRKEQLPIADEAARVTLIRRVYNDLVGLPPARSEHQRLLADSRPTETVIDELIDQLLKSPQFGERWGRHWLDLVRYADTLGHEFDYPLPHAWRYRDYVIRAFINDVPYDQFVREHVAGDLLPEPRLNTDQGFNESVIATGFWYLGEDKHAPVDVRGEEAARIDNQLDVFSKAFLGLTVACARCHDHKFDAITTDDYYALAGFLQSSRRCVRYLDETGNIRRQLKTVFEARTALTEWLDNGGREAGVDQVCVQLLSAIAETRKSAETGAPPASRLAEILNEQSPSAGISHPLSLVARLAAAADAQCARVTQLWCTEVQAAEERQRLAQPRNTVFANFGGGLPDGWRTFGSAFHQYELGRSASGEVAESPWSWSISGVSVAPTAGVSSAVLGPHFRGILTSPTFEITHPEILVRVAGKGTRLRLVVDGYVMNEFSELLFKGLRQQIDSEGFTWIRMAEDTQRYIGHRAHFEFLDDGDGWFDVQQIQFVSEPGGAPDEDSELIDPATVSLARQLTGSGDCSLNQVLRTVSESLVKRDHWARLALQFGFIDDRSHAQLASWKTAWENVTAERFDGVPVLTMGDGSGEDEHVFIRGSHRNVGPAVGRRFLTALRPESDGLFSGLEGSGRLQLAARLLDESNPFPARVMVNRVWHHLFGQGLVPTADNFGVLGQPPTHPDVLDLLAADFREDGWSVKRLIRRLMRTAVYRQSSTPSPTAVEQDPLNHLLSHANVRRLEAEVLRDAMLAVSGRLDTTLYGPPVPVYLTPFMQGRGRPGKSGPLDGAGRRSIYQAINRNFPSPFLQVFDTPPPFTTVGTRSESNVPAQALMLLNNEFVQDQAQLWAARILTEQPASGDAALDLIWQDAFCRLPTDDERAVIRSFADQQAAAYEDTSEDRLLSTAVLTDVCHAVFNQKEFLFLD